MFMNIFPEVEMRPGEVRLRERNPNIERPVDRGPDDEPQPVPPDRGPQPPVKMPPDQPGIPEDDPNPEPIGDPVPEGPTRLV